MATTMQGLIDNQNHNTFFTNIDLAMNVIHYINLPAIQTMLAKIIARQRWVLAVLDYAHTSVTGVAVNGVKNYDVYMKRHFAVVQAMILWYCNDALGKALRNTGWGGNLNALNGVRAQLTTLTTLAFNMGFLDTRVYDPITAPPLTTPPL